ncbi:hypothetical protein L0222_26815 [bacterium]|nr:hypothetical protein [bacterium]MCI0605463.1 hypothetical protein [bacterium]
MTERSCVIVFTESTGRVTGQIREGEEVIKELSFFLGKLHKNEPAVVDNMIRSRYSDWAKINGVSEIEIEYQ